MGVSKSLGGLKELKTRTRGLFNCDAFHTRYSGWQIPTVYNSKDRHDIRLLQTETAAFEVCRQFLAIRRPRGGAPDRTHSSDRHARTRNQSPAKRAAILRWQRPENCSRFSGAVVSGAHGRGFAPETAEEAFIIGVHFKPGGAFPFLGLPAGDLADTHVDLETLWGPSAGRLRERLGEARTSAERFQLLQKVLLSRLSHGGNSITRFRRRWRCSVRGKPGRQSGRPQSILVSASGGSFRSSRRKWA